MKRVKKLLCLLLALVLVLTLAPVGVFAAEPAPGAPEAVSETDPEAAPEPLSEAAPEALPESVPEEGPVLEPLPPETRSEPLPDLPDRVYAGVCGDEVYWSLDTSAYTLSITGTGAMYDYAEDNRPPWYDYRSYVNTLTIADGVTHIGSYAFAGFSQMTSLDLGSTVQSIGSNAFRMCSALPSVSFPASLTTISSYAFNYDSGLTYVYIPAGVTSIGTHAFTWCEGVQEFEVASDNPNYCSQSGALFNKTRTTLYWYPAANTRTAYTLPDSVTFVGLNSFGGAKNLTFIDLNNLRNIAGGAFYNCDGLAWLSIPDSVQTISQQAFAFCDNLETVEVGPTVSSIGLDAFRRCISLTRITFHGEAPTINAAAFTDTEAEARYHLRHTTWTSDKLQNYGGTLTWTGIYGLSVGGVEVTPANAANILGNGTAAFYPDTQRLVLGSTTISGYTPWEEIGYNEVHTNTAVIRADRGFGRLTILASNGVRLLNYDSNHAGYGIVAEGGDLLFYGTPIMNVTGGALEVPNGSCTISGNTSLTCSDTFCVDVDGDFTVNGDLYLNCGGNGVLAWDFTVRGAADLTAAGCVCELGGDFTVVGDLTVLANHGVFANGNIDLQGDVDVRVNNYHALVAQDTVYIGNGSWDVTGGTSAIAGVEGIEMPNTSRILLPEDGDIYCIPLGFYDGKYTQPVYTVGEDSSTPATHVVIEPVPVELWVCGVEVTEDNCDDILGDGKVSFDWDSCVLTLDDRPLTDGTWTGGSGFAIWAEGMNLSVEDTTGNVRINPSDLSACGKGIRCDGSLNIGWNLITTLSGSVCSVRAADLYVAGRSSGFAAAVDNSLTVCGDFELYNNDGLVDNCVCGRIIEIRGDLTIETCCGTCVLAEVGMGDDLLGEVTVNGDVFLRNTCEYEGWGILTTGGITIGGTVNAECSAACLYALYGDVTVNGTVNAVGTTDGPEPAGKYLFPFSNGTPIIATHGSVRLYDSAVIDAVACVGVFAGEELCLNGFQTEVTASEAAVLARNGVICPPSAELIEPQNGCFDMLDINDTGYNTVLESDAETPATHVVIRDSAYPLWVGGVQVTRQNSADIFGNGSAYFDLGTKTLTVTGGTISGALDWTETNEWGTTEEYNVCIYAGPALGSLHIVAPNGLTVNNAGENGGMGVWVRGGSLDIQSNGNNGGVQVTCAARDTALMASDRINIFGSADLTSEYGAGLSCEGQALIFGDLTVRAGGYLGVRASSLEVHSDLDVTVTGSYSNGIFCFAGDLTVSGTAVIIANNGGVEANGDVSIAGDTVITAQNGVGVLAWGEVVIPGGTWDVTGGECAIVGCQGIDISDGHVIDLPAGGVVSTVSMSFPDGKYTRTVYAITEADGTTKAAHAVVRQRLGTGFYLIGPNGWTLNDVDETDLFTENPAVEGEYMLHTTLTAGDPVKVVAVQGGALANWFPEGLGNEYVVDAAHAGNVTVYFRLSYQAAWAAFGGYIWIEADSGPGSPIETTDLHIYSSISVGTDMIVTFTARKNDLTNFSSFWIEVVKKNPDGDVIYTYNPGEMTEGSSTWAVQFRNIFAKEMGLDIEARLYAKTASGAVCMSPMRSANIRDYLGGRLTAANNKVEQRVLAADMLNYGAAAQMFTEFQTDHLVNEELTAEQLVKLREYESPALAPVNKTNYNTRPAGQPNILFTSVTLGNEVLLNLTIRLTEGTEGVQVLVKNHETGDIVTTLDTSFSGSTFWTVFSGIGADKMRTEFDFVTLINGVETGNIRTWSVEGYVGEIRAGTLPLKTAMANALLVYGDSAAAYFAAQ